jgi:GR25 family glycosyltransferase involved in LPS biosynthesis
MQAYCITLNRTDPQRALNAFQQIKKLGFDVQFADGVNVKSKPLAELASLLTPRAYWELKNGREVHEALSGTGSVGCYLAHLNLWKKCAAGTEPIAIFEDDIYFRTNAFETLPAVLREAEEMDYDILRLSYNPTTNGSPASAHLSHVVKGWGGSAYILTPKAASVLVKDAMPMNMHCDYYMDAASLKHNLNHYYVTVPLDINRMLPSTIGHSPLKNGCAQQSTPTWIKRLTIIAFSMVVILALFKFGSLMV